MADIRTSFFVECEELLEALQDGLQALDGGNHDSETINVVFRAVHSIKGGAGAFGLSDLVEFSHGYETVLDAVRAGRTTITPGLLNLFFHAADHLSDIVRACRDDLVVATDQGRALIADLRSYETVALDTKDDTDVTHSPPKSDLDIAATTLSATTYDIVFTPEPELFDTGNDVPHIFNALSELGHLDVRCDTSRIPALSQLVPEVVYLSWTLTLTTHVDQAEVESLFEFVEGLCELHISKRSSDVAQTQRTLTDGLDTRAFTQAPCPKPDLPTAPVKAFVRVDIERVERLLNLVGELVINQAMLAQSLQHQGLSPHCDAMNGLEEFQRLTRDIQDSVMTIRAQPVKSLFQRMARIVRETSAAVSKDVRLITEGDATEVDKTVIERLADPLTHMIRNAVDHGLEATATRVANGKLAQGQVRLSAAHRSGRVIIEVSDNGGGIDRKKVLATAISKGLVPDDAPLSDAEIDNLLFEPGFSTAESVTDLSGRGVGMDVVRTSIQELGGRITVQAEQGHGTTFSISLPLTLAVLDGMVVEVAGEALVLPLNVISETFTLSGCIVEHLTPDTSLVRVRDGFVPLVDLGAALGYRASCQSYDDQIALLLALEDGARVALMVDEIQDQRQVVIKGLDDSFYRAPGIAAATILGDGQIALILDPADIIANTNNPKTSFQKLEA